MVFMMERVLLQSGAIGGYLWLQELGGEPKQGHLWRGRLMLGWTIFSTCSCNTSLSI